MTLSSLLERLPAELQLAVYEQLPHKDMIGLSQASHYFHAVIKPQDCSVEDKATFVDQAQHWNVHNHFSKVYLKGTSSSKARVKFEPISDNYACYSCFRVQPKHYYSASQTAGRNGKSSTKRFRFCINCGVAGGKYRSHRDYVEMREGFNGSCHRRYLICGSCKAFENFKVAGLCLSCIRYHGTDEDERAPMLTCSGCDQSVHASLRPGSGECNACCAEYCAVCLELTWSDMNDPICGTDCVGQGRKARALARKQAKRPWKVPGARASSTEDVFDAEMENVLGLLRL